MKELTEVRFLELMIGMKKAAQHGLFEQGLHVSNPALTNSLFNEIEYLEKELEHVKNRRWEGGPR